MFMEIEIFIRRASCKNNAPTFTHSPFRPGVGMIEKSNVLDAIIIIIRFLLPTRSFSNCISSHGISRTCTILAAFLFRSRSPLHPCLLPRQIPTRASRRFGERGKGWKTTRLRERRSPGPPNTSFLRVIFTVESAVTAHR